MTVYTQQLRVITGASAHVSVTTATGTQVTYTSQSAHGYSVGDEVYIQGLSTAGHNGFKTINAVPTTTTFRVNSTVTGVGASAGLAVVNHQYDLTVLDSVNITGGRMDITSPVSPMTASVDIIADEAETFFSDNFNLNHALVIQTYDDYTSAWTNLFVGQITDINVLVNTWNVNGGTIRYSLQAASAMARLDYHSSAYSGSDALVNSGSVASLWIAETLIKNPDFGSFMYWYGNVATDTVVMHKRSNGTYIDSDVCQTAAASARGNLHDRPDGKLYYSTFASSASPSFYSLAREAITAYGLSSRKSITDVYNKCFVTTTNTALTTGSSSDTASANAYGRREGTRSTELASQALINSQAADFLSVRNAPKYRPGNIVIDLANTNLDAQDRSTLYGTRTNYPLNFDLPTQFGGTLDVLVDNWSWSFSRGMTNLQMQVSLFTDLHP